MTTYGYARISTTEQDLGTQIEALKRAGCETVFSESATGAHTNRKELTKLLKKLRPRDTLVVTRLDRLARSTKDLLNILDELGKREIAFKSLVDTWADTTTPHGRLMLTVLGGIAEFERSLILARTAEGRKRAMERGVKFGRKSKLSPYQVDEVKQRLAKGDTQTAIAKTFGVDQTTISRIAIAMG
jgi:DNA invertase Pin-like site-specific DNA recombinase